MKVVIIGSGNVAHAMAGFLKNTNHNIVQVAGRNRKTVSALAKKIACPWSLNLKKITPDADMYIIAVHDDAIKSVIEQLPVSNKIMLHTSGATALTIFKKKFKNCGVLYPLQTLNIKSAVAAHNLLLCLESSNKATEQVVMKFARTLTKNVIKLTSAKRLKLHLSAVVINNFVNHLYALTYDFLKKNRLDFSLLFPLMEQTFQSVSNAKPAEIQTGPAIRNDKKTMQKHLAQLKMHKSLKEMYSFFSAAIQQYHLK
jgi:predicted short-subunit dehydrogenase-like oxidoreductase (DUF2520 family)